MADKIPTFAPDQPITNQGALEQEILAAQQRSNELEQIFQAEKQGIPTFAPDDELTIQGPPKAFNEIPIFIPDTPPPGEGGIFRGLLVPPEPIEQDLRGSFLRGMVEKTITGNIALGLEEKIRQDLLGQEFELPSEFIPRTPGESVANLLGSFFDPAALPLFGLGGKIVKPLIKPAARFSTRIGNAIGLNKALRKALFRASAVSATGAAQFGTFGGASEVLRQNLRDEKFDAGKIATSAVVSGATGALLSPMFAPVLRGMKLTATKAKAKIKLKAQERFETKTAEPLSLIKVQAKNKESQKLINTLDSLDNNIQLSLEKLERGGLSKIEERGLRQGILKTEARTNNLENEFLDLINGEEYKILRTAQQAMSKAEIVVNGKKVPVWKKSISPRNVVTPAEEINFYMGVQERSIGSTVQAPITDIIRLTHEIDGTIRGRVMREVVEPALNASTAKLVEEKALKKALEVASKKLPTRSSKRLNQLFDHADGRRELKDLTGAEIDYLNFSNKTYSSLLDRINEVNSRYNLPLVKKRKNYVTHIIDLTNEADLALAPGELKGKTATTFQFFKRTGEKTKKNPIESLEIYIEPALRRIHMTQPAADASARVQFMPPRLRKAYTNWIEGPVLGGIDPKDQLFINKPAQTLLKAAEGISASLTGAVIAGSLNVVVQQPSQIIATAVQTGLRNTIRGLATGLKDIPKELINQSTSLTGRSIAQESVALQKPIFKTFKNYTNAIVEVADRYVFKATWKSAFIQAREKMQLSPEASGRYADIIAPMLHANYGQLFKPPILRGRTGKAFFPFQSFSVNMWNHLTRDPKVLSELRNTSRAKETIKVLGAMLATNQLYDAMGLPAPFKIGTETFPILGSKFGTSPPLDLLQAEREGIQGIEDADIRKINRSILGNLYMIGLSDDPEQRAEALKRLGRIVGGRFLPVGNQLKNTLEGVEAANKEWYEIGHKSVDILGFDKTIAILLGPRKTRAVREFQKERKLEKRRILLGK